MMLSSLFIKTLFFRRLFHLFIFQIFLQCYIARITSHSNYWFHFLSQALNPHPFFSN